MPRFATTFERLFVTVGALLALSSAPAHVSAHEARANTELRVTATVLSSCSVGSGANHETVDLDCRNAATPVIETSAPIVLRDGAGVAAITTVNF